MFRGERLMLDEDESAGKVENRVYGGLTTIDSDLGSSSVGGNATEILGPKKHS